MGRQLKIFLVFLFLIISSCAIQQQQYATKEDFNRLKKELSKTQAEYYMKLAEQAAGGGGRWRNCLTGGGSDCIDGITGASSGDFVFGLTRSGTIATYYPYIFVEDADGGTDTEDSPKIIRADDDSGAWYICRFYSDGLYSVAADGEHFMNYSNSGAPSYIPSDGDCTLRRDRNLVMCYDSINGWIPQRNNAIVNYATGSPVALPYKYHYGAMITNFGSTGTIQLDLKDAELGMEMCFEVTAAQRININPDNNDRIIYNATVTASDGNILYNSGTIGCWVCLKAYSGTSGDIDWLARGDQDCSWADGG